jgi:hypothetical protein
MPPRPRRARRTAAERRRRPGRGRRRPRPGRGADGNRSRLRGGASGPARRRAAGGAEGTRDPDRVRGRTREARPASGGPAIDPVGARAASVAAPRRPGRHCARRHDRGRCHTRRRPRGAGIARAARGTCPPARRAGGGADAIVGRSGRGSGRAVHLSQAIADRRTLPPPMSLDADAMQEILKAPCRSTNSPRSCANSQPRAGRYPRFRRRAGARCAPGRSEPCSAGSDEADAAGVARPGVVLATRPNALVTTPWPASVRYAGPLLDYGNVIILEPESDYLLIVAGLATLFVQAGDLLTGDAPLGLMPGPTATGEELILSGIAGRGCYPLRNALLGTQTGRAHGRPIRLVRIRLTGQPHHRARTDRTRRTKDRSI